MKRVLFMAALVCAQAFGISPVPVRSKVFITATDGFDVFLTAALAKKGVPVVVVADREKADYELQATAETQKAGWAKILLTRNARSSENASIRLVDLKTGEIVYAYAYNMGSAFNGRQSSAESCAKHLLKAKIWTAAAAIAPQAE